MKFTRIPVLFMFRCRMIDVMIMADGGHSVSVISRPGRSGIGVRESAACDRKRNGNDTYEEPVEARAIFERPHRFS